MILNEIEQLFESYDTVILMEGHVPILRFVRGELSHEQLAVVLLNYTQRGHTYWLDGYNDRENQFNFKEEC